MGRMLVFCIVGVVLIAGVVAFLGGSLSTWGVSLSTVLIVGALVVCCGGMLFGMRGISREDSAQRRGPHAATKSDRLKERR